MDILEVTAVLEYIRPLPYYMAIDSTQKVKAFVDGFSPVEEELRGLESFRKAVVKLAVEGIHHPPGCEEVEEPFVRISLTAGEAHQEPSLAFHISLGLHDWEGIDVWMLRWDSDKGGLKSPVFPAPEPALALLKHLLDRKTGQWATLVAFRPSRVDS